MKYSYVIIFYLIFICEINFSQTTSFNRGVNLTSWFQTEDVRKIQFSKYDKNDFKYLKELGCDIIRLPINFHSFIDSAKNIDPLLFYFLDMVVNWAEEIELNLIIDNHSFNTRINTEPSVIEILKPIWKQIAEHYKDKSKLIYYEILNEPHGIKDSIWNSIQQEVINEIRKVDDIHTIIVGAADWNNYKNLNDLPYYSDSNLIYTFHFYDPFIFTHQGSEWIDPPVKKLKNIPFPYDKNNMPQIPNELKQTWIESLYNKYDNEGTEKYLMKLIDMAVNFKDKRNVKLFCGEFGVLKSNVSNKDRIVWHKFVADYFNENNISWTVWDYDGDFGIRTENNINIELIESLGFNSNIKSQKLIDGEYFNITIYNDFIEKEIVEYTWNEENSVSYFDGENPADGDFSISWKNADRYNYIGFDFIQNINLKSFADDSDVKLKLFVKGNKNIKFDICFVDSKNNSENNHPNRVRYTVDANNFTFDNNWHFLEVPLKDFTEYGIWYDNKWYNPEGKFDWSKVDRLQIIAEHQNLNEVSLYFDKISIGE